MLEPFLGFIFIVQVLAEAGRAGRRGAGAGAVAPFSALLGGTFGQPYVCGFRHDDFVNIRELGWVVLYVAIECWNLELGAFER